MTPPMLRRFSDALLPDGRLRTEGPPVRPGPGAPHAVVVGAGFGGLAAAIRLGARGYRVTVVDRLDQAEQDLVDAKYNLEMRFFRKRHRRTDGRTDGQTDPP